MESYIATCPDAAKDILSQELREAGAVQITQGYRMVRFQASQEDWYKMHLTLATASNLFQVLKECSGANPKILNTQAGRIAWHKLFSPQKTFKVNGIAGDRGSESMTSNEISKQVRHAIEEVMEFNLGKKPQVELKNPDVIITCHVHRKRATICVSTSGKALHKRGYRMGGHPAPVKETMAATLLKLAGYDGSQNFYDPMCGSGTILIEAAFLSMNKACNIHRKKDQFGLEHLKIFDRQLWRSVQESLRQNKEESPKALLCGSDISEEYIEMTKDNSLRARVEKFLNLSHKSFFDSEKPAASGILLSNLPYGERIGTQDDDLKEFYKKIGDTLKKSYSGWKACLFVNDKSPWKFIGLKPSKKIPLLNGSIPTKLLIFDLYEGSKRGPNRSEKDTGGKA